MSARLSPGEYVMNRQSFNKFSSQILSMNSGAKLSGNNTSYSFGDFTFNNELTGVGQQDVVEFGKLLRREIRRGTVRLS